MNNEGYCDCACRDCFEIAIGKAGEALCNECEDAGCEAAQETECCVEREDFGTIRVLAETDGTYTVEIESDCNWERIRGFETREEAQQCAREKAAIWGFEVEGEDNDPIQST